MYVNRYPFKMVLALILLQMVFGVAHLKEPFLMSGYSTLLPSQTVTPLSRQLTVIMRISRKDTTRRGSEKWNIHPSHLSYSPQQVVLDLLQAHFTSDYLQCWQINGSSHIAQPWAGYNVDSLSVSSDLGNKVPQRCLFICPQIRVAPGCCSGSDSVRLQPETLIISSFNSDRLT